MKNLQITEGKPTHDTGMVTATKLATFIHRGKEYSITWLSNGRLQVITYQLKTGKVHERDSMTNAEQELLANYL